MPWLIRGAKKRLRFGLFWIRLRHDWRGFSFAWQRADLMALLRGGHGEQRLARRANAMLLLDDGWSCERTAKALYLDDDTIRGWRKTYDEDGLEGLRRFEAGGSASHLSLAQEEELSVYVSQALPRSTREVGVFIEQVFGVVYESRSGLIALMHRLGLEYKPPRTIGRRLDAGAQQAFIEGYGRLLNWLSPDEAALFMDAVHPTYAARAVGCWAPRGESPAVVQTSGRERLNIHGALDLETGKTAMIEVESVDAASTVKVLEAIEARDPALAKIHVFLDNARYHHAVLVQEWLAEPGRRIRLRFIPSYAPISNPIERLWGLMHKHLTHNKSWRDYRTFAEAVLWFLRDKVPTCRKQLFRDSATDNFRVINPKDFRAIA